MSAKKSDVRERLKQAADDEWRAAERANCHPNWDALDDAIAAIAAEAIDRARLNIARLLKVAEAAQRLADEVSEARRGRLLREGGSVDVASTALRAALAEEE